MFFMHALLGTLRFNDHAFVQFSDFGYAPDATKIVTELIVQLARM